MKLQNVAYSRSGDKGDISNVCVFPYLDSNYDRLVEFLTVERVQDHFGAVVRGPVTRYLLPGLHGMNFVMEGALAGGVSISLRTDPHDKSLQSHMLSIDIDESEWDV
jgi:hypothetical protein